jgi:hypothetical protein
MLRTVGVEKALVDGGPPGVGKAQVAKPRVWRKRKSSLPCGDRRGVRVEVTNDSEEATRLRSQLT